MSLNKDQQDYVRYLHTLKPEHKCWCGWYRTLECWNGSWCHLRERMLTNADRLTRACPECGNAPHDPGMPIVHRIACSKVIT